MSQRREIAARHRLGFTVVELGLVLALLAVLSTVAIAKYLGYVEKARVAHAAAEIREIAQLLDAMALTESKNLPDSLAYVGAATMIDPWGRPYQYLRLRGDLLPGMSENVTELPPVATPPDGNGGGGSPGGGGGPPGGGGGGGAPGGGGEPPGGGGGGGLPAIAQARKDRFLVPINSDYDLYSMGADGKSLPQLHSSDSRDDVIRARDGAYVGLAEFF